MGISPALCLLNALETLEIEDVRGLVCPRLTKINAQPLCEVNACPISFLWLPFLAVLSSAFTFC